MANPDKLEIKPIPDSDISAFHDLLNDEGLARNAGTVPHPVDLDWTRERLHTRREEEAKGTMKDRGFYEEGTLVGSGGYFYRGDDLEIGYSIHRDHRGRGLATRVARLIIDMARADRLSGPLVANYFTDNPASGRVLEKVGFRKNGMGSGTSMAREGDIESQRMELHGDIFLADPIEADYPFLFDYQNDTQAQYQAGGGTPFESLEDYTDHLQTALANGAGIQSILHEGTVTGYLATFDRLGHREISYWIGRPYWNRGIATQALALWLLDNDLPDEGLYARVMKDHPASARVLEKCGFVRVGEDRFHSDVRGGDVDEYLYRID
ncbi:MAG: GNAT N-acetyltransferase [Alphaproteobacteria bacterium]|nr:GNAT N-acetyltransferase [Alphaproteobacteria bacterium]